MLHINPKREYLILKKYIVAFILNILNFLLRYKNVVYIKYFLLSNPIMFFMKKSFLYVVYKRHFFKGKIIVILYSSEIPCLQLDYI